MESEGGVLCGGRQRSRVLLGPSLGAGHAQRLHGPHQRCDGVGVDAVRRIVGERL